MSALRETLAWAGGLFEGEGCVSKCVKNRHARASLAMADRDVVERFHSAMRGVGTVRVVRRGENKTLYEWGTGGFPRVQAVVAMLWLWLGERRRARAREVLLTTRHVHVQRARTHCPAGHPYSGDNLIVNNRGGRVCRTCSRQAARDCERRRRATKGVSRVGQK